VFKLIRQSLLVFVALTLLTGVAYPLLMTVVAQGLFPHQANGSLIERNGKVVGSELIGQQFDDPRYFWGRPSATGPTPYNAAASTGSNFGPTNPAQLAAVKARIESMRGAQPNLKDPIPVELVTASASGLDPEISPAAADFQIARVARAREIDERQIRELVAQHTEGRALGLLGEPRIDVLELNLALDELVPASP
jgi:potassium-transporting ATPase KdpC subunit